jgi:uncharacterized protein YbjT (DUF2867 family)
MTMEAGDVVGLAAAEALRRKRILLVGATGKNGGAVLKVLGDLGLRVRATSRSVGAAGRKLGSQHEWVRADVTDPASLTAPMTGIDIVISAAATARPFGSNRPEQVDYEGTRNLIRAAQAAGVRRFVIITSSVSGRQGGLINLIGRNVLVWKGRAEEALIASGLEYVIVGPARINADPGGRRQIRLIPRAEYRPGLLVTREDLAAVVAAVAALPAAANRTFSVINADGPADLAWQATLASMPVK